MTKLDVTAVLLALLGAAAPAAAQVEVADASADQQELPTQMLRLRSGEILWGSIVTHEPDAVHVRRLENGGMVRLPWSLLDPTEENELRLRFGYVDASAEELMTDADRIVLADGTEIIGRIVNRTDDHVWFKRADGTIPIDKRRLGSGTTIVQVPALDIFTKEELFQEKAFELQQELLLDGLEGARAHDELAQFAERLLDYPHAVEHYKIAAKLDATFDTERIEAAIARTERKALLQEQVDVLAEIDLMRARKRYDKALALLQSFPELYPDTPLLEDWNKLRDRVAKYQERDLREEVVRRFHYWSVRLSRDAARQMKTFEEVLGYLDEQMSEDLLNKVTEDAQAIAPGIQVDEVRQLWEERQGGRYRQASYGVGTWLLGEDRARAALEEEDEESDKPEKGSQAEARKKLEERIQRYLRNQELARKAQGSSSDEEDPNELWGRWNFGGRYQWILAHFAENSGLFRIHRIRFSNCRECAGKGTRQVLFTGSARSGDSGAAERLVPCGTCHTIGVVRRVRYR